MSEASGNHSCVSRVEIFLFCLLDQNVVEEEDTAAVNKNLAKLPEMPLFLSTVCLFPLTLESRYVSFCVRPHDRPPHIESFCYEQKN